MGKNLKNYRKIKIFENSSEIVHILRKTFFTYSSQKITNLKQSLIKKANI